MADMEAVEKITIEGGEEAQKALHDIGNAGAEAFARIAESAMHGDFTGLIEKIGGELAASFYKAGEAIVEFVHAESEAVEQLAHLSEAAGASIGQMQGLQEAFASVGISTQGFERSFGRLAMSIGQSWSQIQSSARTAGTEQQNVMLGVQQAVFNTQKAYDALAQSITHAAQSASHDANDLKSAQLNLERMEINSQKALGVDTSGMEKALQIEESELQLKKARQAVQDALQKQADDEVNSANRVREAEMAVTKARLAEQEARQKAYETDLKDIDLLAGKINQVAEGTLKWNQANVLVDASAQNIRQAIIKATSVDNGGGVPSAVQVFEKLSGLFKGMGNDADTMAEKMAIVQRLMGAGFRAGQASATQLVAILNQGPEAIKKFEEEGKKFSESGIGISEKDVHALEDFHSAWAQLSAVISQVAGHIAAVLSTGLTPWLEKMKESLENNDGVLHRLLNLFDVLLQLLLGFVDICIKVSTVFYDIASRVPILNAGLQAMGVLWDNLTKPMDEFLENWNRIKDAAGAAVDYIVQKVTGLVNLISGGLLSAINTVKSIFNAVAGAVGGGDSGSAVETPGAATGGLIRGPGGPTDDMAGLFRLSDGEFVMRSAAVAHYGAGLFHALNSLAVGGFAGGGMVGAPRVAVAAPASAGASSILNLSIDGKTFKGLRAPPDTARDLKQYAVGRQSAQTGFSPSWRR